MATVIPPNTARFTLAEVAQLTGGELLPGSAGDASVCGVCLDSRALTSGNLFVALRGERHDAHAFLAAPLAAGAFVLVQRGHEALAAHDGLRGVAVDDTLLALGDLAQRHRARFRVLLV
jgi:UDP-N-acetylmuramoyl-tripeptide--D-alanyl-D-alanine ligase